jgi:hypothetical protein
MVTQPAGMHLVQLNVGRIRHPTDDPRMAEFMGALDGVNALAERSPGFVWRLKDDSNNATSIQVTVDPTFLINMSVWETAEHLEHFVWNTVHKRIYAKKGNWFEPMQTPHFVMWWIPAGHIPTPAEALARLAHLAQHGPGDQAFGWESLSNVELLMSRRCA